MSAPSDARAREEALDPRRSFIVQAPAGSGKTGLLTQRYLKLLSRVAVPEEIVALTFTKKAAGEMRERILEALHRARSRERPESGHEALVWELADAVLQRDRRFGWNLEENPARLQILTIDALCGRLGHALPILSQFGASPQPVDDASMYYLEAARRTLGHLDQPESPLQPAVAHLLRHLDNNIRRVTGQIAGMLARRDKWMRPLVALLAEGGLDDEERSREALEAALRRAVEQELSDLRDAFPSEELYQLVRLIQRILARDDLGEEHPLQVWKGVEGLPGARPEDIPLWQSLGRLLLNLKQQWRGNVGVRQGFLPESETKDRDEKAARKADKVAMRAILGQLADLEDLRRKLVDCETFLAPSYTPEQWKTLRALLMLSHVAAGELLLVFKSFGKADFIEIARRAEQALGTEEEPTDVAMVFDAKISHLLVDEFQDTSLGQLHLLRRLIAEWIPGEGRTIFLVGDPMQSIYRFRDAEVGLFLRTRSEGLPPLELHSLGLTSNFRSQAGLVDWFNRIFSQVFPRGESLVTGAVPYSPSLAAKPEGAEESVRLHPVVVSNLAGPSALQKEADAVVEILRQIWTDDPERKVAILIRSRGHLGAILPTLRRLGYRYQGVDLEPLQSRPVVRDLLALTRALVHPADRVAWLSVLRAPWCGLTSEDLHTVADDEGKSTIYDRLADIEALAPLTESGRERLSNTARVLREAAENRRRLPLRRWVEGVWLALGGPATVESLSDLEDAQAYLGLLDRLGEEHSRPDLALLEQRIAKLYAQPDVLATDRLQVMTIHKSKGLQFDTVILPGLSATPRRDDEPLLSWFERPTPDGGSDLLLAPITERGDSERDPVYRFVHSLESKKGENELVRLLYVAATRAERQLHLVARVMPSEKESGELREPGAGSFLRLLWPALGEGFSQAAASQLAELKPKQRSSDPFDLEHPWAQAALASPAEILPEEVPSRPLEVRRLCDDWIPPPTPPSVEARTLPGAVDAEAQERPEFEWAGLSAQRVGTVVHRVLQQVGREGAAAWPLSRMEALEPYLRSALLTAGLPEEGLEPAVQRARRALEQVLESPRGRWIFATGGEEARNEYAVSGVLRGRIVRAVVDRTFVDEEGTRWVVDYKTGSHEGGDVETFLDNEVERYRPQLERYAALLSRLDGRPVKKGLFFPLLGAWREWE